MNIGTLDRYITVQKLISERDHSGAAGAARYEDRCEVWASRKQLQGRERIEQHQNVSTQEVEWCMWWRSDIERTDRIVFDSKNFEILDIIEEGYREGLRILTRLTK